MDYASFYIERGVEMRTRLSILIVIIMILGYISFTPLQGVESTNSNMLALITGSTELEIEKAMNEMGVREISINEFERQLKSFEKELDKLLDF